VARRRQPPGRKRRTREHATCGQVRELLQELGFTRKQLDDRYDAYYEKQTDMFYALPRWPDDSPARETDIIELRAQLYFRGLMEKADFDAYFANFATAKS
jgi:hypothetical protein